MKTKEKINQEAEIRQEEGLDFLKGKEIIREQNHTDRFSRNTHREVVFRASGEPQLYRVCGWKDVSGLTKWQQPRKVKKEVVVETKRTVKYVVDRG